MLPNKLPDLPPSSTRTIKDLATMSSSELLVLGQNSAASPLGAMLPAQPGVLPEREAFLTGGLVQ